MKVRSESLYGDIGLGGEHMLCLKVGPCGEIEFYTKSGTLIWFGPVEL